jgi:hypothetical protein
MRPAHRAPLAAAFAAAVVLAVAGCGSAGAGVTPSSAAAPPGSTSAAPATATPGPSTSAGADPSSSAPAAATKTYTFPDGRPSFEYPADWRVELFTGEQKPATSATATVFDASGTVQATIYAGKAADGVSFPVARTVFESAPVPGLSQEPAPAAHYSFYVDRMDGRPTYRMHLTAGAPQPGDGSALDGIIRVGGGVLVAEVKFIDNPFGSDAAAKTWLAGAEGQSLKALLLSIDY